MLRHRVRAGITGWAQVHGWRGNTSIRKRLQYDLYYIENWSLLLDLKILWMTLRHGLRLTPTERRRLRFRWQRARVARRGPPGPPLRSSSGAVRVHSEVGDPAVPVEAVDQVGLALVQGDARRRRRRGGAQSPVDRRASRFQWRSSRKTAWSLPGRRTLIAMPAAPVGR